MRRNIVSGLSGLLLGTTALTGVALTGPAMAQDVTSNATVPSVTIPAAVNVKLSAAQSSAGPISGSIVGSNVSVLAAGPIAADVIISATTFGASGTANSATETILASAPGARRAIGVAQTNANTVDSSTTGSLTGLDLQNVASGGMVVDIADTTYVVTAQGNVSTAFNAGGALVVTSTAEVADANAATGTADALGEITTATAQINSGAVTSTLGGSAANANLVGVDMTAAAASITNTGGVIVSGTDASATAAANTATSTVVDAATAGDIDVAVATSQSMAATSNVTATASFNDVGIDGVSGATITGAAPGEIPLTISGNAIDTAASGNTATHTITTRPGAAGDQVDGTILQEQAEGAIVTSTNNSNTFGVATVGTDLTNATITVSGNGADAMATGNSAAQDVTVDVGGVAGGGITTTTTQTSLEEDVDAVSTDHEVGVNLGGGNTLSGVTVLVDGNDLSATGLLNTAGQSLSAVTGDISATISQSIDQTSGDGSGTSGIELILANSNRFGVINTDVVNNSTIQISNNSASAFAAHNNATSARGDLTGNVTASVTQEMTQEVDTLDLAPAAFSENNSFGVDLGSDTALAQAGGDVGLLIANNSATSETAMNVATGTGGDLDGTVNGAINIQLEADQTNTNSRMSVGARSNNFGFAETVPGAALGTGSNRTDLTVSGNEASALGRGNMAVLATGDVTGTLSGGATYSVTSTQTNNGIGNAANSAIAIADENDFGLIGSTVAHGIDNQDFDMLVLNNASTATYIGNVAVNSIGEISGTVTGANAEAEATQTNQGGVIAADVNSTNIGVLTTSGNFVLGTLSGNVATFEVTGNRNAANTVGNFASTAAGDVTGTVSGAGAMTATATQTNSGLSQSSNANAAEIGVQAPGGTGGAGADAGTVTVEVSNNTNVSGATGNEALARLGDFTGTISNDTANLASTSQTSEAFGGANSTMAATSNTNQIGYFDGGELGENGQTVNGTFASNAISAATQVQSATNIVDGATGTIDGATTEVGTSNTQTITSAVASATAINNAIGAVDFQAGVGIGNSTGPASITASGNSVSTSTGLNEAAQIIGGAVGNIGATSTISLTNTQNATPAAGAAVSATSTLSDAQIGISADGVNNNVTMGNAGNAEVSVAVSNNLLMTGAEGNDATQTLGGIAGVVGGTLTFSSNQDLGAETVISSSISGTAADPAGIGLLGLDDIAGGTDATANIAIAVNTALATAAGNNLTQNIVPGGLTGTLTGMLTSAPTQDMNGVNMDASVTGAQIGLSNDGFASDTSNAARATTNLTVSGNGIGAAASGNTASLNLGDVTGTVSGGISLTPTQSNAAGTDIDAALNSTGIGVDRGNGEVGNAANSVTNFTIADNVQSAALVANDSALNTEGLGGALSGTVTLTNKQTNDLSTGAEFSATILNADTGVRLNGVLTANASATLTPIVADNNVVASLVGNRSGVRMRELAVSGGGATVNAGATQLNTGDAGTDPTFVASLGTSVETGVHLSNDARNGITAIVSGNNASADLIGNAAITQFDDVTGVLSGSINVTDSQTNTDIFGNATVGDIFTQVDANAVGTLSVSSVLNDNRIGASVTGNMQAALVNTSGLAIGGSIGVAGTQSNAGGAFRSTVTGSIIGVELSAGTSITGTSIVRGGSISATSIGNSATATIR